MTLLVSRITYTHDFPLICSALILTTDIASQVELHGFHWIALSVKVFTAITISRPSGCFPYNGA